MSDDDKVGVEAEMEKWQQVADMIGGTLDDVCNMAEGERSELVLLISADKSRKDNIDPAKDDDDVLLASSDSEDDFYGKPRVYSHTNAHERQVSEPSLKKLQVMLKRCGTEIVDLSTVSNDKGPSSSFNSAPIQNSENSTTAFDYETEINSPIFKKRSKKNLLKPTNGRKVTINEGGDDGDLKSVECDDENNKRKCLNAVFQKVLSLSSNNLNDVSFLQGTLEPIVSDAEYFNAMTKNPQKYKLDNRFPGLVSLKRTASATIEDIYKGFEGVKFVKSQAVSTGKEDPSLVSVVTDSSVREGIAAVKFKRRGLESGMRRQEGNNSGEGSERNGGTRFTRTTRNSINATSSDIFDGMFDTGAHDSADDFEVNDNDYLDELELNKKGTAKYKRSRIIISDSDDDFKIDDVKDVKKDKKAKNSTSGTGRNPPGTGENKLGGKDKIKAKGTRGRGKGKLAEKDDSQTSMLNFVGSNRIGNLNANEKLGLYDPMSHLVKLGGDQSKDSSSRSRIYDPFSNRTKLGAGGSKTSSVVENFGTDRSDDPSPMMHRSDPQSNRAKLKAVVERKVSKTNQDPHKKRTGLCPLCLTVQLKSQLEKHAAECSGDAQGTGTKELCPGCLELIPAEAFKDHSLRCNTDWN